MGKLQVKGNNIPFKADLKNYLQEAMEIAQSLPSPNAATQRHSENLPCNGNLNAAQDDQDLRKEVTNMSKELKEIKALLVKAPRTWSQVVTNGERTAAHGPPPNHRMNAERAREAREERAKYSVTLTASEATNEVKRKLEDLSNEEIVNHIQHAIDQQYGDDAPKILRGMNKYSNWVYRIQCEDPEDAKKLRTMNWEAAFEGLTERQRKYSIVIHGVPKEDLNPKTEDNAKAIAKLEEENITRKLHIAKLDVIKQKESDNPESPTRHHSIVIFTHDSTEANACIDRGVIIRGRMYSSPARYAPQLSAFQCYNCLAFGHIAAKCRKKAACSNCGEAGHRAAACTNPTKCLGCGEAHQAWNRECRRWDEEKARIEHLRRNTPPRFNQ
jgi:Zinc knuckle.